MPNPESDADGRQGSEKEARAKKYRELRSLAIARRRTYNQELGLGRTLMGPNEAEETPDGKAVLEALARGGLSDHEGRKVGKITEFIRIEPPRKFKGELRLYAAKLEPYPDAPSEEWIKVVLKFGVAVGTDTKGHGIAGKDHRGYADMDKVPLLSGGNLGYYHPLLHFISDIPGYPGGVLVMEDFGNKNLHDILAQNDRGPFKAMRRFLAERLYENIQEVYRPEQHADQLERVCATVIRKHLPPESRGRAEDTVRTMLRNPPPNKIRTTLREMAREVLETIFTEDAERGWQESLRDELGPILRQTTTPYGAQFESALVRAGRETIRAFLPEEEQQRTIHLFEQAMRLRIAGIPDIGNVPTLREVAQEALKSSIAQISRKRKERALANLKREYLGLVRESKVRNREAHYDSLDELKRGLLSDLRSIGEQIMEQWQTLENRQRSDNPDREKDYEGRIAFFEWESKRLDMVIRMAEAIDIDPLCSNFSSICVRDGHLRNMFILEGHDPLVIAYIQQTTGKTRDRLARVGLGLLDTHSSPQHGMLGSSVIALALSLAHPYVYREYLPFWDAAYIRRREKDIMEESGKILGLSKEQVNCQRRLVTAKLYALKTLRGIRGKTDPESIEQAWENEETTFDHGMEHIEEYQTPEQQRANLMLRKRLRGLLHEDAGIIEMVNNRIDVGTLEALLEEKGIPYGTWPKGHAQRLIGQVRRGDCELVLDGNGKLVRITNPAMIAVTTRSPDGTRTFTLYEKESWYFGERPEDVKFAIRPRRLPSSIAEKIRTSTGETPMGGALRGLHEELKIRPEDYHQRIRFEKMGEPTFLEQGQEQYPGIPTLSIPYHFSVELRPEDAPWDALRNLPRQKTEIEKTQRRVNVFDWKEEYGIRKEAGAT